MSLSEEDKQFMREAIFTFNGKTTEEKEAIRRMYPGKWNLYTNFLKILRKKNNNEILTPKEVEIYTIGSKARMEAEAKAKAEAENDEFYNLVQGMIENDPDFNIAESLTSENLQSYRRAQTRKEKVASIGKNAGLKRENRKINAIKTKELTEFEKTAIDNKLKEMKKNYGMENSEIFKFALTNPYFTNAERTYISNRSTRGINTANALGAGTGPSSSIATAPIYRPPQQSASTRQSASHVFAPQPSLSSLLALAQKSTSASAASGSSSTTTSSSAARTAKNVRNEAIARAIQNKQRVPQILESMPRSNQKLYADDVKKIAEDLARTSQTPFNVALETLPSNDKVAYRFIYKSSSPPGYTKVPTTADGNCLFHSVYYAWHPEEGIAKANLTASAESIRQIVSNTVTIDDLYGGTDIESMREYSTIDDMNFKPEDIQRSITLSKPTEKAALQAMLNEYNNIVNNNQTREQKEAAILALYKKIVLQRTFWGDDREIKILNKYAASNGLPPLNLWHQGFQNYLSPYSYGRPIHFNGSNHYSILQEINTSDAAAIREGIKDIWRPLEAAAAAEETRRLGLQEISYRRNRVSNEIRTALRGIGISYEDMKKITADGANIYRGPQTAAEAAEAGKAKAIELGIDEPLLTQIYDIILDKATTVAGGSRKTRKHKQKSKSKKTRKH